MGPTDQQRDAALDSGLVRGAIDNALDSLSTAQRALEELRASLRALQMLAPAAPTRPRGTPRAVSSRSGRGDRAATAARQQPEEKSPPGADTLQDMAQDVAARWRTALARSVELSEATERAGIELLEAEDDPAAVAGDAHTYELIVRPFRQFTAVQKFLTAIGQVPGVQGVRIRRLHQGVLLARVEYEGAVPLHHRLATLEELPLRITGASGNTIELAVAA